MGLNKRNKILILIDWYEPGYKAGGPIRSIKNMVDHLKGEAEFYIITRDTDYHSATPYSDVLSDSWNQVEEHVQVYYTSESGLTAATIKILLTQKVWNTIYINGIYSWYFSILPLILLRGSDIRIVVAPRGMLAAGALGVKSFKKKVFLSLVKLLHLFKNVTFHSTHEGEASEIRKHIHAGGHIVTAPNLAAATVQKKWNKRVKRSGELKMVSIARVSPEKNTLYSLTVLQHVSPLVKINYHLFGPINDQKYWQECQQVIQQLPANINVDYKGSVPNELVTELLAEYHLLFLPSRGENFGHVILEALTSATPVLISDRTPWRELQFKHIGWDLDLSEPIRFSNIIEEIALQEQEEYDQLSKAAYEYAISKRTDAELLNYYRLLLDI